MDDNQTVDQLTEGITPFQPEAGAISEVVTPAPSPEFTPAPVITPAKIAEIDQAEEHQELTAENKLGEIVVTQAEQERLDAEDLIQKAPALRLFSELVGKAKDKHVGQYATMFALGILPAIAQSKFGIHGMTETIMAVAPGGVIGGRLGATHEPVSGFVEKHTNLDMENLSPAQKAAFKVADVGAGAIVASATGFGGNEAANHIRLGGIGDGFRMVDEYIPAAIVGTVKGIKSAVKSTITSR